jgi:dipeptidyl aminopeptidase/acylaminoacyl peptidase
MKSRFSLLVLIVSSFLVVAAALPGQEAQKKAVGPADGLWTAEDILLAEFSSDWELSPDSKHAVWVKAAMDRDKNGRVSNIFLTELAGKKETQLTRGSENHSRPKWSPDGRLIAFLSSRPLPKPNPDLAGTQLWVMNPFGGEPYPVTELARGIQDYYWVDGDTVVFSAQEDPALYEQQLKKKKDTTRVVDDVAHEPPVRLFRLTVKDRKITRLTANSDFINEWAVSPDGKKAVASHHEYLSFEWDQKTLPRTYLYDLETGARRELFVGMRVVPAGFRWTRDGAGFFTAAPYSSDPRFFTASIMVLYYYDVAKDRADKVDLAWDRGLGGKLEVTADGFVALLADGVKMRLARYVKAGAGWKRADIESAHAGNIFDFALSRDGRVMVYEHSTASTPAQWYAAGLEGTKLKAGALLTDLNPSYKNKTPARTEIVRWNGALGEEVEGLLYYPKDYQAGKRYPLFTAPHGGPAAADLDAWDESYAYPHQLITQRGAFVFKPNYHGSAAYGLKFVESICCGKYYEYPVEDIEKGVDHLIARGLVDPDRIGSFGWSNGSILSIGLSVANPDRYKVIGAGAGDVEYISDWANVDFGQSFDAYYLGKSPLEDPELYIRVSPFFKLDRVKAPTIIFFGTEDRNVPTSQGWSHYRALYHLGKVPVKFLLFPGEPHGLRQLSHQLRKVEEEMAWFDRYFFKTCEAANEAFKKDSPLGRELERAKAARVGNFYGLSARDGKLIPEAVRRGTLEVARFEVTRAQFAAFDPSYEFPDGTGNLPANAVTFEKAKAYAAWLAQLTGREWRLPTEEEAAELYGKSSGADENTLDWWAGYALNPDDAGRLMEKVKELGGGAPLLKEVGRFAPAAKTGEEPLYDLGGNVAEWVTGKDGKPKAMGGSADRPADAKAAGVQAAAEYIGFRVVRTVK